MKYIDADKLNAEIDRLYNGEAPKHDQQCDFDDGYFTGIGAISQFIDSLQQESIPDTDILHTKLVNLLKKYRIGEETARTMADRIADTYGAQRYMDGLCDGLNEKDTKQEQPESSNGKFVFPNFLYARTVDNKTIDVSYAPQNMDAVEYIKNDPIEQPEVDLEKEIKEYFQESAFYTGCNYDDMEEVARYFYNLGLNARKEENK